MSPINLSYIRIHFSLRWFLNIVSDNDLISYYQFLMGFQSDCAFSIPSISFCLRAPLDYLPHIRSFFLLEPFSNLLLSRAQSNLSLSYPSKSYSCRFDCCSNALSLFQAFLRNLTSSNHSSSS